MNNSPQNISDVERVIRLTVGFSMISVVLFMDTLSPGVIAVLGLGGTLPVFSGIMGWCPFHAMFNAGSRILTEGGSLPYQLARLFHL